ncbi:MAG TPA: 6-pyruvoyl-tetrahydropterin synthase-related protein, partial [Anaerolineae bacterium]
MEKIRRQLPALAPLLLITLFGLPLITPLLHWTAVPCTHDGHLHYHRIAAMRHAWENGIYFTRWLPDLAFGYGYPFFVYREPVPLYTGLFLHLLGLPLPAASNLLYILSILAAGWFMYLWVRDVMGSRAGLVSAVAYMAAPYVLVDALIRGNLPESLALALFPFLLWIGRRWLLGGSAANFLAGIFGLALLGLSHNISLLLFTPVLLLYLLAMSWLHRLNWRVAALRLALLVALGLGVTTFYAGGALLEMDQVTLEQSTTTRNNDFRFNFASASEILAPVVPEDSALINPPLAFRLGLVPSGLALLGLSTLFWRRKRAEAVIPNVKGERQWHIGLMAAATAAFVFMSLPASQPLWEVLPLIDFVQFPWRFIGRAALPVAFLASAPFASGRVGKPASSKREDASYLTGNAHHASRITHRASRFTFYAAIALLLLEAFPNLYP